MNCRSGSWRSTHSVISIRVCVLLANEHDFFVSDRVGRETHGGVDVLARELRVGVNQISFGGTFAQFAQDLDLQSTRA